MSLLSSTRLENWLRVHLLSCLSLQDEATTGAITINYSLFFPIESRAWFWFCWMFLPVKIEFFLSTVATCMLSMRDCCKVNASDCPLSLHAHPGGGNAASH
ncbi:hypothetical protein AMECASPLE_025028 [Ameca splendens]|uniref:Uncharacterized protein n=1 Tax=Ameca splendens TaxID=208324 RepID=A0ABV0ZFX6_9TELE